MHAMHASPVQCQRKGASIQVAIYVCVIATTVLL